MKNARRGAIADIITGLVLCLAAGFSIFLAIRAKARDEAVKNAAELVAAGRLPSCVFITQSDACKNETTYYSPKQLLVMRRNPTAIWRNLLIERCPDMGKEEFNRWTAKEPGPLSKEMLAKHMQSRQPSAPAAVSADVCEPIQRSGPVWYFPCKAEAFEQALGEFLGNHPEYESPSWQPADNGKGTVVVFKEF